MVGELRGDSKSWFIEKIWLYLQRISTARRPIAQASRNGDAPGREIVKIVHPLLDSENIEEKY